MMKIVYLIQAYKFPQLLVRLVQRLNTDDSSFLIHVDRKTDPETFDRMRRPLLGCANVHFMKRYVTRWGDFSCVTDVLRDFKELITRGTDYDVVMLISGQDYPIKTNEYIQKTLDENRGKSFLSYWSMPYEHWWKGGMHRFEYWHFHYRGQIVQLPHSNFFKNPLLKLLVNPFLRRVPIRRSLPMQLVPFGGSNYWCLTRECAEYIDRFSQQHPSVPRFFKRALYPTESFYQTVLMNSPLRHQIVNNNLRYIDWSTRKANPKVLTSQDFEKFMSTDSFFARKFDPTVDLEVLDRIDRACDGG
jgi:hypothetical protein